MWDRANDAINTIIRRDESTEAGELLPPCVEGNNFDDLFLTLETVFLGCSDVDV